MLKHFLKSCAVILLSLLLASNIQAGINFDGTDDFVSTVDFGMDSGNITFSVWVNGVDTATSRNIVCAGTSTNWNVRINLTLADKFSFAVTTTTPTTYAATDTTAYTSGWHHILGVKNGTSIYLYVDGIQVASNTTLTTGDLRAAGVTDIGRMSGAGYYSNDITEVAIWNTNLTDSEIALLANSRIKGIPLQIQPSALKGYWPVDDQEAGTSANGTNNVKDLSGNSNHGSGNYGANATGLTWQGESVLSYPSGIIGSQ